MHVFAAQGKTAKAVADTDDTVEYRTMISCTSKLKTAVSGDLDRLCGWLFAKGLITKDHCSELGNRNIEDAKKAAKLVDLIQRKVNLNPDNYYTFIRILKEDSDYYRDILCILNRTYDSQGNVINPFIVYCHC